MCWCGLFTLKRIHTLHVASRPGPRTGAGPSRRCPAGPGGIRSRHAPAATCGPVRYCLQRLRGRVGGRGHVAQQGRVGFGAAMRQPRHVAQYSTAFIGCGERGGGMWPSTVLLSEAAVRGGACGPVDGTIRISIYGVLVWPPFPSIPPPLPSPSLSPLPSMSSSSPPTPPLTPQVLRQLLNLRPASVQQLRLCGEKSGVKSAEIKQG